jgi:hypothetical protein
MDQQRFSGNADGIEDPHDILAAEEFAMPAHGDVKRFSLPGNVDGIEDPHDILAAEDFAMPAGPDRLAHKLRQGAPASPLLLAGAAAAAVLAYAALKRR